MDVRVDGYRVGVSTGGRPFDPARPTAVLVHGAGMDRTVWALQARSLAAHGLSVLAVDLPGHGESEGPPLPTVTGIGDWLARLIVAARLDDAALAGHSMGAAAALECAARHPDRVRTLALVAVSEAMPVNPALLAAAHDDVGAAIAMMVGFSLGPAARLASAVPGLWTPALAERVIAAAPRGVLGTDLAACAAWSSGAESAGRVRCPTLLVLGAADRMTPPKAGRALAARIPGAVVETVPDAGHLLMQEAPDAVSALLRARFG
jgi:pimeloyl-ACP methyl ester carboxylesterase